MELDKEKLASIRQLAEQNAQLAKPVRLIDNSKAKRVEMLRGMVARIFETDDITKMIADVINVFPIDEINKAIKYHIESLKNDSFETAKQKAIDTFGIKPELVNNILPEVIQKRLFQLLVEWNSYLVEV